jgi:ADP-ribosyl-[dinitrogen reductase] hydrolase
MYIITKLMVELKNLSPIERSLIGIAIGDALGSQYEFYPGGAEAITRDFTFTYFEHPRNGTEDFLTTPKGMYTDDTQMTIANCRGLIAKADAMQYPQFWIDTFRENPIRGYSKKFQEFMESVTDKDDFLERMQPTRETNGGAMRAIPFGYVPNMQKGLELGEKQATVTHAGGGISAAVGIAYATHLALYSSKSFREISHHVATDLDIQVNEPAFRIDREYFIDKNLKRKSSGVPCHGMKTLAAVLYVLERAQNSCDVLETSIKLGGDTDSVAALALGIYALRKDITDLPQNLITDFYPNVYDLNYILKVADDLERTL